MCGDAERSLLSESPEISAPNRPRRTTLKGITDGGSCANALATPSKAQASKSDAALQVDLNCRSRRRQMGFESTQVRIVLSQFEAASRIPRCMKDLCATTEANVAEHQVWLCWQSSSRLTRHMASVAVGDDEDTQRGQSDLPLPDQALPVTYARVTKNDC